MADNYLDRINKILSNPRVTKEIEEEKFNQPVAFPDADATEEEIADFLNGGKEEK